MGRTAPFVLVALIIGTTARAQDVAAGVGKPVVVVSADHHAELGRAIPFLEKQAVDRQAFARAIERTGLAEQPPKISLMRVTPNASLLGQTSPPPSRGLRRSTKVLIGTAIGAGIGVSVAAGLCGGHDCEPGPAAGAVVVLGGTGAGVGALLGFLASR